MNSKRILVVDDERIVAEDIAEILEMRGHTVVGKAASAAEAVALAQEHLPDLILMDIVMPGEGDGIDAATTIHDTIACPVVFLTAYSDQQTIERAKAARPYGYIVKPFDQENLATTVEIALHRAEIEASVREHKDWFSDLLGSMPVGVLTCSPQGQIQYINPAAAELIGISDDVDQILQFRDTQFMYNGEELIDLPTWITSTVDPRTKDQLEAEIQQQGSLQRIPVEIRLTSIKEEDMTPKGFTLLLRNITAERSTRDAESLHKQELENLIHTRTAKLRRMLRREKLASDISDRFLDMDLNSLKTILQENLMRFGRLIEVEVMGLLRLKMDGECEDVWKAMMYDRDSTWLGELKGSQLFADRRSLAERAGILTDLTTQADLDNPLYRLIQQQAPSRAYGLVMSGTQDQFFLLVMADWRSSDAFSEAEIESINGLTAVFANTLSRVFAEEERDRIQEQLLQSQKMEAIGQLSGGVAHDFNNLLVPILGFSDMILEQDHNVPGTVEAAGEIKRAAESACSLTRQLLAFSRKQVLQKDSMDLNVAIANMEKLLQRLLPGNTRLKLTCAPSPAWVIADEGQIQQVIMNLVVNARDAMPQGGDIQIQLEEDAQAKQIHIQVQDNGCGMPEELQKKIFDPFFSTKGNDGTGLGLSVVYGIVEQHDGQIRVESTPGKGTTFHIELPQVSAPATLAADTRRAETEKPQAEEHILLVEDDKGVLRLVSLALKRQGYVIHPAETLASARELFAADPQRYHLLLCDAMLPDGNGLDLAQELRKARPDIPILISSGYTDRNSKFDLRQNAFTGYLQKPYKLDALRDKVREIISGRSTRPDGQAD